MRAVCRNQKLEMFDRLVVGVAHFLLPSQPCTNPNSSNMGKSKKPFIDKKNASTYHLLYRSQRDVAGDETSGDDGGAAPGVVLWPSPGNSQITDQKVLLGKASSSSAQGGQSLLQGWKSQLSNAGLVDDYDYERHMKPITGTGVFFDTSGKRGANALADVRSMTVQEDLIVREVDRQLESIALTASPF